MAGRESASEAPLPPPLPPPLARPRPRKCHGLDGEALRLAQAACDKLVNSVLQSAKCTDNVSAVLVMLDYTPSEASDEAEQQGGT